MPWFTSRPAAPDAGEDFPALAKQFFTPPASSGIVVAPDGYAELDEPTFLNHFAGGVPTARARPLCRARTQRAPLPSERTTAAAWHDKPSWYQVSTQDRTIDPDLERHLAQRMGAHTIELETSHLSLITERERLRSWSSPAAGDPRYPPVRGHAIHPLAGQLWDIHRTRHRRSLLYGRRRSAVSATPLRTFTAAAPIGQDHHMNKIVYAAPVIGALAAAALGLAGVAQAASSQGSSAADTVSRLTDQGYNVQLNGSSGTPLSQCTVSGVHGESPGRVDSTQFVTVYVDVSCPSSNN